MCHVTYIQTRFALLIRLGWYFIQETHPRSYEWVMSHIWRSHVTYRHDSRYSFDSVDISFQLHILNYIIESRRTYEEVTSLTYRHDSRYAFDLVDISFQRHTLDHIDESRRRYDGVTYIQSRFALLIRLAWHFIPATHPRSYKWVTSHI